MALENYYVLPIDNKLANEVQVKNHYLHTKASCREAFGLFISCELVGVILYGNPSRFP